MIGSEDHQLSRWQQGICLEEFLQKYGFKMGSQGGMWVGDGGREGVRNHRGAVRNQEEQDCGTTGHVNNKIRS